MLARLTLTLTLLAACNSRREPPPIARSSTNVESPPAAAADRPSATAGTKRVHLAAPDGTGAVVSIPDTCTLVDGHTFSSTAEDLRLHLNIASCPTGCGDSVVGYLDSPEARSARGGGELAELRAVGDDAAVMVVKNPVLDLAAVVRGASSRRLMVSCSGQAAHEPAVAQAIIDTCLGVGVVEVRAPDVGSSAATYALLCHPAR